jgi:hypothetical protein
MESAPLLLGHQGSGSWVAGPGSSQAEVEHPLALPRRLENAVDGPRFAGKPGAGQQEQITALAESIHVKCLSFTLRAASWLQAVAPAFTFFLQVLNDPPTLNP